jgi:hypothetical protein
MSGRSCSDAGAVFLARNVVALEEATHRTSAEDKPLFAKLVPQVVERGVCRLP